jgi:hypothetical protein
MYLSVHMYYLGGVGGRRLQVLGDWLRVRAENRPNRVVENALPSGE